MLSCIVVRPDSMLNTGGILVLAAVDVMFHHFHIPILLRLLFHKVQFGVRDGPHTADCILVGLHFLDQLTDLCGDNR